MKKFTFFLLLFPLFVVNQLQASHYSGATMRYEYIGNCTYRIYHTTYLDCSGAATAPYVQPITNTNPYPDPASTVSVMGIGGIAPALSGIWTLASWREIPVLCPSQPTNCSVPNSNIMGQAEITYYTDYNLCGATCNSVKISWSNCCRNYALSGVGGGNSLYLEMTIDLVNNPNNSSPIFLSDAPIYLQAGQSFTSYQLAFDPDCDSLVYSLDTCYSAQGQMCNYQPGFSPSSPLGPTWFVNIDASTGELSFMPNPAVGNGAVVATVIGIGVSEYRNGMLIGHIKRDVNITAIPYLNLNHQPLYSVTNLTGGFLDANNHLHVAANLPCSFDVTSSDLDIGQLLAYSSTLSSVFPNSSITGIQNTNPLQFHVSFTPDSSQIGACLHLFIDIADDNCPVLAHNVLFHLLNVHSFGITEAITPAACGLASGGIDLTITGGTAPFTFSWSNGATTQNINNLFPGIYSVQVSDAMNQTWPGGPYYLTAGNLNTTFTIVPPDCNTTTGAIVAHTSNGQSPYSYLWNTGQTTDSIGGLAAGGYSVNITDSAGCFDHQVILLNPDLTDSCFSKISGRFYYDTNNNCVQDSWEAGIANIYIDINPGGAILTDSLGDYEFSVYNSGNYVITCYPNASGATASTCLPSTSYNIYMPAFGIDSTGIDFPYDLNPDISVVLSEGNYGLANSTHHTYLYCHNASYYLSNATLTYQYSPIYQNLIFSIPPTTYNAATQTATWNFTNFTIGTGKFILIQGQTASTATLGDTVTSFASILPITGDVNPQNNQDTSVRIVVASYDPNNKEVSPQGETSYGLIPPTTPKLEYVVNFQNTGNWAASYVAIRDTIDDDLDITSIDMQMSSHPCTVTIEQDKILVFTFNNINLPDSSTDEPNSHGFVKFGMNLKPNLPLDTHIDNTAYIYFDFNAPVITNTAHSTLYEKMEITMNQNFMVCPGDVINIEVQKGKMPYNFTWSNGTSNLNNTTGTLTIPANFTNGTQSVVVTDFYGASKTIYFTVSNQPIANANFSFSSAGNLFFFNANDLGQTSYSWNFGNGQTSNLPTHNITFASAGSYQVSLIVTDNCGGSDTMTQTIVVTTDISDAAFAQSLTLFPNPTHNISTFAFSNPDNSPYQLTISDLSGKTIQKITDIRSEKVEVNHENNAKGAYLWELKGKFTARGMLWVE